MSNKKILRILERSGPIDLSDPLERTSTISKLASVKGVSRQDARVAVDVWANNNRKNPIISNSKQRENVAVMISKQAVDDKSRVPLARAFGAARERFATRNWDFNKSKGKGRRRFDGSWTGHIIGDARNRKQAEVLSDFLRRNNVGRVRLVPYSVGNKTHYSVYSETPVDIANQNHVYNSMSHSPGLQRRLDNAEVMRSGGKPRGVPLLTTKRNIPKLGIKVRRTGGRNHILPEYPYNYKPKPKPRKSKLRFWKRAS